MSTNAATATAAATERTGGLLTFEEWAVANREDIQYEAVDYLDTFGLTGDVSRIVREHTLNIVSEWHNYSDEYEERDLDDYRGNGYGEYETYEGPTRAALVHWAWNSHMDLSEFGPEIEAENVWQQIEWAAMENVTRAAFAGLSYAVNGYREYLAENEVDEDEDTNGE